MPTLHPDELETMMQAEDGCRLIDVRTPVEFESARISSAYNVPLQSLEKHAPEIAGTGRRFVLICQSGARARQAAEMLQRAGLSQVQVLEGGMNAWLAAQKPALRGIQRISLERQVRIVAGGLAAAGGALALLVHPWFALLPLFIGGGLVFAGVTDRCGMASVLSRLPYNGSVSCDVDAMVKALCAGTAPVAVTRSAASN